MAIITEKKQVFILDGKYSIAKNKLRFLIGGAEPTTAQDAKKQAPVSFPLYLSLRLAHAVRGIFFEVRSRIWPDRSQNGTMLDVPP
jgi:hypothetical protein